MISAFRPEAPALPRAPAAMARLRREPPWLPANRFQSVLASPEARLEPLSAPHGARTTAIGRWHKATPPSSNGRILTFPLQRPAASSAAATWKLVSGGECDRAVDSSVCSGCRDMAARPSSPAPLTPAPVRRAGRIVCRIRQSTCAYPYRANPRAAALKSWSDPSLFAARFQAIFSSLLTNGRHAQLFRLARTTRATPAISHNISQAGATVSPCAANSAATASAWPMPTSVRRAPPGASFSRACAEIRR